MTSSGRYFSVPLGRSSEITPDNDAPLNFEDSNKLQLFENVVGESSKTGENFGKGRSFPKKRKQFFTNRELDYDDEDGDTFKGAAPVDEEKVQKYSRGSTLSLRGIRTKFYKQKFAQQRRRYDERAVQAARAELLLPEEAGFIEPDDNECTYRITQKEIVDCVDILSATKRFELDLPKFGSYRCDYTRNGRYLLLGGRKGHVAAIDWTTKDLLCEINVAESVRDVKWLHNELMFAVAQKRWTYLYDNKGTELHSLKNLYQVRRLEFLPYHFLLVAATSTSFLHWLDISTGKLIRNTLTKQGPLDVMCINPANAVTHVGSNRGTVTLWSPNVKDPLVNILCHGSPVRGLTVDQSGVYMATSGADRMIRVWDLRNHRNLYTYSSKRVAEPLVFSQRRLLAAGVGTRVQIFHDPCLKEISQPYLVHDCREMISSLRFCPYEDVLGIGHRSGFVSILAPGAGEPNLDAFEANPYQSKKARREAEVKALLDKIQPEMITLEPDLVGRVDTDALERKLEDKLKILYVKPPKIDIGVKNKTKGKGGTAKKEHRKRAVKEQQRKELLRHRKTVRQELEEDGVLAGKKKTKTNKDESDILEPKSALDRFKSKT